MKCNLWIACSILLLLSNVSAYAQDPNAFVKKGFLIVASCVTLKEAKAIAETAALKTGIPFHDEKLEQTERGNVSFPASDCEADGFEYPCYVARGRYDDGEYISIEYSDAYEGFKTGYFIVIAASYAEKHKDLKTTQHKVRKFYPSAYIKNSKVYIGCMH